VTPLQKVGMGLVVVFLTASFGGYDALADPIGWLLVISGLLTLRRVWPQGPSTLLWAGLAAAVSVPVFLPAVEERLVPSGRWALSLPQTIFCIVLCTALAGQVPGEPRARRLGILRTAFLAVAVGPVLVYGGGVGELAAPVTLVFWVANVYLVWLTFRLSGRVADPGAAQPDAPLTTRRPPHRSGTASSD
jgi:hypothetical protein